MKTTASTEPTSMDAAEPEIFTEEMRAAFRSLR